MNRLASAAALVAALGVSPLASASPNLVVNGDFETNGGLGQLGAVSHAAGWTQDASVFNGFNNVTPFNFIVDASADSVGFASENSPPNIKVWGPANGVANGFTGSANGGYFLGADGDYAKGPVWQQIAGLTVGASYQLSFEWAASQFTDATGATTQRWDVSFGGSTQSTNTVNLPSQGFSGWMSQTFQFTAVAASQTLSFLAQGGPTGLPPFLMLDGVSLTASTPPVPEPGTWALLLAGLGLCGRFARRRVST